MAKHALLILFLIFTATQTHPVCPCQKNKKKAGKAYILCNFEQPGMPVLESSTLPRGITWASNWPSRERVRQGQYALKLSYGPIPPGDKAVYIYKKNFGTNLQRYRGLALDLQSSTNLTLTLSLRSSTASLEYKLRRSTPVGQVWRVLTFPFNRMVPAPGQNPNAANQPLQAMNDGAVFDELVLAFEHSSGTDCETVVYIDNIRTHF